MIGAGKGEGVLDNWTVHWLTATGDLAPWRAQVATQIEAAEVAMGRFVDLSPLDIVVERGSEDVIPEVAMRAFAQRGNLVTLKLDPFHDAFEHSLLRANVTRELVRAVHQAQRLSGPGYGFTLGGAMVSEGLAGQFVRLVLGSAPDFRDTAVADLECWWPEHRSLMTPKFDHGLWFNGTGAKPRWLGHSLGFKLVENWLTSGMQITPQRMIEVPAPKVLAAALAQELAS